MTHTKFILSPLSKILTDVILSSRGAGSGIESTPLCDYVMQSAFLRLTGAQEQKMKCIFWEIASRDYEYRYKSLRQGAASEYSTYDDKEKIYRDLKSQIESLSPNKRFSEFLDCNTLIKRSKETIKSVFEDTNLVSWSQRSFSEYEQLQSKIERSHIAIGNSLFPKKDNISESKLLPFGKCLRQVYIDHLYTHRNRIAHNTLSYQQNLPTLTRLKSGEYVFENYFLFFYLIILIDYLLIDLFEAYLYVQDC